MQQKKVLIITYYWPPAGGPGVQRWLKFAKYLPEFGWEPVIYTPENPSYPLVDESLINDVPPGIETIRTKIWEPYQLAEKLNKNNKKFKAGQFDVGKNQSWKSRLSIWVRGNFFIPDARVFWVNPSVKFLERYLKEHQIDVVVTSGPPHSLHLIGLGLKKKFESLKWIADFRDPWTEISYYKHLKLTSRSDMKHRRLEREVFAKADLTLATSYSDAENFRKKGAHALCITNGFDESDAERREKNAGKTASEDKFTLSYIGVLEQLRNPEVLWKVLMELVATQPDFTRNFQLKFAGKIDDRILDALLSSNLKNHITNLGYLSHDKAVEEMNHADLLLITNFPDPPSKGIIPGKIFEYLATGKQIISFGPEDADVAKILDESQSGKHFSYNSTESVKSFILDQYNNWKNGIVPEKNRNISQFSRKHLTGTLAEVLNQIVH
ncbi:MULTISPECIES: glycosyltransferase family 4 protein [Chryseobacterium]|uniref:Glycosyltransferase involved in cell wall biosynthesis n=1 Tax=Chryseobacterium camelliae TaxID=1265445 RepID=A0ABU0TL81_9FLAO|nr:MULTISPECIES: glycosyltransferase family 4 protein [Chryseobacterium]MDT3409087.1 glycosyltransferase involved in cell wall biosynthesis [Pseudacidovorax intermedius]MDQ1097055.1 glycosyltransferase involved in cell wall biosynthesis [Chryseobacterium camelliae]MDQ1100993.1 glycosyltransferase involved in cell wall biosynthesis [Chryseobacterium sp. SORGH_AS_1048]MDR6084435.1 glycosyltransferase involved in cell wall biosynthesis [Chryseobacterium sp. SORGH_AS_0909]MDR6132706.1 glycosyltran